MDMIHRLYNGSWVNDRMVLDIDDPDVPIGFFDLYIHRKNSDDLAQFFRIFSVTSPSEVYILSVLIGQS